MSLIVQLIVNTLAVMITAFLLQSGVQVASFWTALVVAVVLGVINTFIKPIVTLLTLPINFLTLGLFSLIINGLMIMLVGALVEGFEVTNFLWAVLFSIVLSLVNAVLGSFTK
ncbi:MAG TPA: phage holin family protein [Candidatus Woesebacteria bacterium]|nr:phage holin family protein [Candidatus Woesebacteria bacterium]